jgi:tRNA G26 N,N-dimethylase Trm1
MTIDIAEQTFSNRDEFQRKEIIEKFLKLLKSEIDISPIIMSTSMLTEQIMLMSRF